MSFVADKSDRNGFIVLIGAIMLPVFSSILYLLYSQDTNDPGLLAVLIVSIAIGATIVGMRGDRWYQKLGGIIFYAVITLLISAVSIFYVGCSYYGACI